VSSRLFSDTVKTIESLTDRVEFVSPKSNEEKTRKRIKRGGGGGNVGTVNFVRTNSPTIEKGIETRKRR